MIHASKAPLTEWASSLSAPGDPNANGWDGRREDARALTGRGRYVTDLIPAHCLHLAFKRSDEAGVAVTDVALEDALAQPGVVTVLSDADTVGWGRAGVNALLDDMTADPAFPLMGPSTDPVIRTVGQPLAAVIAADRFSALDGAEAISVETRPLSAAEVSGMARGQGSVDCRWGPTAPPPEPGRQIGVTIAYPRVAPQPMEPRASLAIPGDDGRLTVYLSTQSAHRGRADLAAILKLDPDHLRVIAPDVGGAFGGKASLYPEDVLTAAAALKTGQPVVWVGSRAEDLAAASHGRGARITGTAALDANGRITRIEATGDFPLGAWMPFSSVVPMRNFVRILPGPYAIAQGHASARGQTGMTAATGIYRGAGRPEAAMVLERLMDQAARATGTDPITFRRRHLRAAADLPTTLPFGDRLDSGDYSGLLDRLEEAADLPTLTANITGRRRRGEVVGMGVALYVEPCGAGWESARARLLPDGRIGIDSGSSAQGQGRETAYASIAATALGIRADAVDVRHSDTDTTPAGIGALASRGTTIGGSAVAQAATRLKAEILKKTAEILNLHPSDLDLSDGLLQNQDRSVTITLQDLARRLGDRSPVIDHRFETAHEAWASGAVLALMAIDPETGVPSIERIIWVDDAGRTLNPVMVDGQLIGGMAQGVGEALMEAIRYDEHGQLLTGSLMDYTLPRARDVPTVTLLHADMPSTANPLGVKGVGEAGCIGVPAAILNAAIDAVSPFGVTNLNPPLTAETLWRALQGRASIQETG